MHIIPCATPKNSKERETQLFWDDLKLPTPWQEIINVLMPDSSPRPVQVLAIRDLKILASRKNLLVSAPTNSGKTLIGYLILFEALRKGKRALLLEPLRAIAQEKADELRLLAPKLSRILSKGKNEKEMRVILSTGDYRLEDEEFSSPPPVQGELIVATPERVEAILRNPQNDKWLESVGAVFVDEAHLLASPRRGGTLEYLITLFLLQKAPPRLVLVSATMGNLQRIQTWISPCDQVSVSSRYPDLHREIWSLEEGEESSGIILEHAEELLNDPEKNLLIFVYQTRSAESLAKEINSRLPDSGCKAFHSRMSLAQKKEIREDFFSGRSRVLVATTALALGVNLPATDLIVRDVTFPGVGVLGVPELIQMSGRAGRGDLEGRAIVFLHPRDHWSPEELKEAFEREDIPPLVSPFDADNENQRSEVIAEAVSSLLSRSGDNGLREDEINSFFARSLAGENALSLINGALRWLCDSRRALAYKDQNDKFKLTVLGQKASRSAIPLPVAAGAGNLFRDLLRIDPEGKILDSWQQLDQLILLHLLYDGFPGFKRYSVNLSRKINVWMEEDREHDSVLYRQWLKGTEKKSGSLQVFGSVGIHQQGKNGMLAEKWAFRLAQQAIARSCLIFDMSKGAEIQLLERYWGFSGIEGVEEKWRDSLLWLLAGLSQLMDVRCFYFHLKDQCNASPEQIRHLSHEFKKIRWSTIALMGKVKYCSPFGSVLQGIRRFYRNSQKPVVGLSSFKNLADQGIRTPKDIASLTVDDLVKYGIRRNFAEQIGCYMRKRLS